MKVVVFGASGRTGQHIVAQALARKLMVTAFVRHPEKLLMTDPALHVVQGDVADYDGVASTIIGHDAVTSALGVGTPLKHDATVILGIQHIIRAMQAAALQRFIYLSFIGVHESRAAAGPVLRYIARFPLRHEIADHEAKEHIVTTSTLDWTIVRAPKLTDGQFTGVYRSGETIVAHSLFPRLSRANVADFIVRQLADAQTVRNVVRVLP